MADLLIKHLKSKTEEHSALGLLYSQWDFDEKLIPKALQTISILFPHYSRHDESHSRQILVNIERLLGENIKLLTATDTWMLLESAYWHDIGMVVSHADLQAATDDPEFLDYVNSIASQPQHELYAVASGLRKNSDFSLIFQNSTPLEMVSKFREFFAEWFRRKHPARAEQIIRSPLATAGISSPRTELIPARLFKLLGRICQMHGAQFADILAPNGLPFREAGLAQDDCHPRFVASLLRMGDLLDLDDNRFCPVMQRIAGPNRPLVSKAHEDKHAGMRHLRIDQERIEVIAECETVDGYLEAFRWFDWLKQEVQNQMTHWRDIVPNRELGLLPMLGPLTVRLRGDQQILKEGERPAYSIDANKAVELLQGNNLYSSRYACIRELLQNAVDATLIRIWLMGRKVSDPDGWASPDDEKIKNIFSNYSISVTLQEAEPHHPTESNKSTWTLTISDEGTGISRNDLLYMLKIGGSHRNSDRQREISNMPEWMKPSGAFGIGMQSVFMLCDDFSIRTKSIFTNEILDITFYSPTGAKEGLVVLRQLDNDISVPYGTHLKVTFDLNRTANYWHHGSTDDSIAYHLSTTLDPVLDENQPFEAAELADQVARFGERSLIPVQGRLATSTGCFEISGAKATTEDTNEHNTWKFIKTETAEVRIKYKPAPQSHLIRAYYRGQRFDATSLYFPNAFIEIDVMSGAAGSWLNFSRDKISNSGEQQLYQTLISALERAVNEDLNSEYLYSTANSEERAAYSFFLKGMALEYGEKWTAFSQKLGDAWLDVTVHGSTEPMREYFSRSEFTVGMETTNGQPLLACDLAISDRTSGHLTVRIINSEWEKLYGSPAQYRGHPNVFVASPDQTKQIRKLMHPSRHSDEPLSRNVLSFRREQQPPYDARALATEIYHACNTRMGNRRYALNFPKFFRLSLKSDLQINAWPLFDAYHMPHPVLLPFLFCSNVDGKGSKVVASAAQLDKLSRWVQPRLATAAILEDIRMWYDELIQHIDVDIMKPSIFWDTWKTAREL